MKVLVAFEFSGAVRDAFRRKGVDAVSCDLEPSHAPGPHMRMDARIAMYDFGPWDGMIAFPPCTDLAVSGARWFKEKQADGRQQAAIDLFMEVVNAPISRIAIENPVGIMSTKYRAPDQIIHPWMFGHGETKATCLWLKNLPKLAATCIVDGRRDTVHFSAGSADRARRRSRTYSGIAAAMADQWSDFFS